MEIRELRYILEIEKTRHIPAAAKNLFITQPALHKSLRKVESELNVSLFYRKGNELIPTDAGGIVLSKAKELFTILKCMNDDICALKSMKLGNIKIGFPSIVGELYLARPFTEFQKEYPNIIISTVEAGEKELISMAKEGAIDMAIITKPIHSESLNEIPLICDQIVARVSKEHPLACKETLTVQALHSTLFNTLDQTFNMRTQLEERFQAESQIPLINFSGASCRFLYEISVQSNEILVLPKPIIEFFSEDNDLLIPFDPIFPWELCLIFRKSEFLSNANRAMISHLQKFFL